MTDTTDRTSGKRATPAPDGEPGVSEPRFDGVASCPNCGETRVACEKKTRYPGACWRWNEDGRCRYRTIVVDPPWHYGSWPVSSSPTARNAQYARRHGLEFTPNRRTPIKYPTMTVAEIAALPVGDLACVGCHVYLWTTNKYLPQSFDVLDAWGARYSQLLVWCKTPMGKGPGGAFAQNAEYVLHGRIGSLAHLEKQDSVWFNWPRTGTHSKKPEAFLDLVERVSPAPRLEMFARRNRLGWDTWGNESLGHVELGAA